MPKIKIIFTLMFAFSCLLVGCTQAVTFDPNTWHSLDEFYYPEEKYGMALWLMDNKPLIGMDLAILCDELFEGNMDHLERSMEDGLISIPLRNRKEYFGPFSYYDEHLQIIDAYMYIYIDYSTVTKVEIVELKDGDFLVTKSTAS